jgi:hypothetical protein
MYEIVKVQANKVTVAANITYIPVACIGYQT